MGLGLTTVKFFPAEAAGGIPMLSSLAAPYQNIRFMPTGGIDKSNLNAYLALPNVIACGGSFMVKSEWLKNGNWDAVRAETEAAVKTMLGLEMGHFAIMARDKDDLTASAEALGEMLCLPAAINPDGRGAMVGGAFEVLNSMEEGLYPHSIYHGSCGEGRVRENGIRRPAESHRRDPLLHLSSHVHEQSSVRFHAGDHLL